MAKKINGYQEMKYCPLVLMDNKGDQGGLKDISKGKDEDTFNLHGD